MLLGLFESSAVWKQGEEQGKCGFRAEDRRGSKLIGVTELPFLHFPQEPPGRVATRGSAHKNPDYFILILTMEQKLPQGLVTISSISPAEMSGPEQLDNSVIKNLWQVYYLSRQASNDQTENRLEYLFWRIWGNAHLLRSIDVKTLDRLVMGIMAEQAFNQPATGFLARTKQERLPVIETNNSLHSILKKPKTPQSEPQKTTRLLIETPDGESITRNPSNPLTPSMPDFHTKDNPAKAQGHKTYFTAPRNGKGTKRRPQFPRRKPSQVSIPKSSQAAAPKSLSPKQRNGHAASPEQLEEVSEDDESADAQKTEDMEFPFEPFEPLCEDEPAQGTQLTTPSEKFISTSWTGVNSIGVPVPVPELHSQLGTPQDAGLASNKLNPSTQQAISPAVFTITDKQDPILSQELETVGDGPKSQEEATTEPQTPRSSEQPVLPIECLVAQATDVPGFPGAQYLPMPEEMLNYLAAIITEPEPLPKHTLIPVTRWFRFGSTWVPLHPRHYVSDLEKVINEPSPLQQPSTKPLVRKGFRTRFANAQKRYSATTLATIINPGKKNDEWQDEPDVLALDFKT
ncbi:hypothetical protein NUU61_002299 [Penicillium alfredii]|uniref:Nitrogen regulatory protein areA GATA-like domain-containing protein n=1 Tax=Penicillium alfredii TaxID=1506179 RepID=A0A9W9FRE5_9EURO|nr:uncharacterized protein NUU61_002299 [Penicillium alfredii]KAJ5104952.1 hypothetical protein NUU61_002299 [Penicillium alfredii]